MHKIRLFYSIGTEFSHNGINLNRFYTVKTLFDTIETASDKIRTVSKQLEDDIGRELSEILRSIVSK